MPKTVRFCRGTFGPVYMKDKKGLGSGGGGAGEQACGSWTEEGAVNGVTGASGRAESGLCVKLWARQ